MANIDPLFADVAQANATGQYNRGQQGIFGLNPLATPKYAKNKGLRDAEYRDTLARLYISLADASTAVKQAYLESLPSDAATQALANVLLVNTQQGGTGFIDFFLTQAAEQFQEILQLDKVLADDYVAFLFGQEPPKFQYSGVLLNSMQDDQRAGFGRAYLSMLRGTQMARRGVVARLRYDSVLVSGVMIAHTQQLNADNEMAVPFSFTFLVKEYVILNDPSFTRLSAADYVQLQGDAVSTSLSPASTQPTGQTSTTTVLPPNLLATSVAGAINIGTGLINAVTPMAALVNTTNQVTTPPPATSNVRGNVDTTNPSSPPPAQAFPTPSGLRPVPQLPGIGAPLP